MEPLAPPQILKYESQLWGEGYDLVAGVDEAGRGPLAGPVVAAAVILPKALYIPEVYDSKSLSPRKRELLFERICQAAISIGIGVVDNNEIDRMNILKASLKAMKMAVEKLSPQPDFVLVDGIHLPDLDIRCMTVKKGGRLSLSIASASIIAKVTRDRMMIEFDRIYPQYGFAKNKGYPTPQHYKALSEHGPCPIHRKRFRLKRRSGC
ncbi:TPA: ribonuclease HII [Candidatus Poribacteria bacterium]|nr:ribonuclease HII [Candidatus Poribacteria bacterium]